MAVFPQNLKELYLLTSVEKSGKQLILNKTQIVSALQTGTLTCEVKMTSGETHNIVTDWADLTVLLRAIEYKNEQKDGK
jgi:hypothetical protein